jgi:hypothetical protein
LLAPKQWDQQATESTGLARISHRIGCIGA